MSQWRHDPITDRWVIIAKNRAERPNEFKTAGIERKAGPCPFCGEHQELTPPAFAVIPAGGDGERHVRVVPNKYPALNIDAPWPQDPPRQTAWSQPAFGSHEVIIESTRHLTCFSQLDPDEALATFQAIQQRLAQYRDEPNISYVQVFKNAGPAGGASIEHVHSQLMALPVVPAPVRRELEACRQFYVVHGTCAFCKLIERELDDARRLVWADERFVALCPFASRFPYETWILPRLHQSRFEEADDDALLALVKLVQSLIGALNETAGRLAYNFLFRWGPFDTNLEDYYHWRMELFPRMIGVAAFEWATDCFVNPVPPEEAASCLRIKVAK